MNRQQRRKKTKKAKEEKKSKAPSNVVPKIDEKKIIDKTLAQYQEKFVEAEMNGIKYATNAMFAVLAVTLHDKWGWGQTRTKRLFDQINETFDSVNGDYVQIEELIKVVHDELGIKLL